MNQRKSFTKRLLDYEIGHLVKSPCRDCVTRYRFPGCSTTCDILDRIQTYLAQSISSSCSFSDVEPFRVQLDDQRSK